jgi:hypothetical protein
MTSLLFALLFAAPLDKPAMVQLLAHIDDRQKNQGDWRSSAYMEQKERDKADVVYEMSFFRRSEDRRLMIVFQKPKA